MGCAGVQGMPGQGRGAVLDRVGTSPGQSQSWSSSPPGWFCGVLQVPAHGIDAPVPTWMPLSKHFSHRCFSLVKNPIFPFYAK